MWTEEEGGGQNLTFNRVLRPWNYDMLNGVHPSIHHLDHLIQRHKRRLQTRQLDQRLDRPPIRLPTPLDLLSSLSQPGQTEVVLRIVGGEGLELREEDTGDVFLLCTEPEAGGFDRFLDLVGDVAAADGVGYLGQGEGGDLHDAAHFAFGFVDAAGDF